LYERTGWEPGAWGKRTLSLKATGRAGVSERLKIEIREDDGSFNVPKTVRVIGGQITALPIDIHPTVEGVHSAILFVESLDGRYLFFRSGITVIASAGLDARANYTVIRRAVVRTQEPVHFFVTVPSRADAIRFSLQNQSKADFNISVSDATGRHVDNPFIDSPDVLHRSWQRAFTVPESGVWEITVSDTNWPTAIPDTQINFTASLFRVAVAMSHDQLDLRNRGAVFEGDIRAFPIRNLPTRNLTYGVLPVYEFNVPEKAEETLLRASDTDSTEFIRVYLFQCIEDNLCVIRAETDSNNDHRNASISMLHMSKGLWKAVILPYGSGYNPDNISFSAAIPMSTEKMVYCRPHILQLTVGGSAYCTLSHIHEKLVRGVLYHVAVSTPAFTSLQRMAVFRSNGYPNWHVTWPMIRFPTELTSVDISP
jgi:hypothetical protein